MRIPANVMRVDRKRSQCELVPVGTRGSILARFPDGQRPPAPLSPVLIEQQQGGQWLVVQNPSQREQFLFDDFLGMYEDGTGNMWAGIYWGCIGGQVYPSSFGGGQGIIAIYDDVITAPGYINQGSQVCVLEEGFGYWLSCQVGTYATLQYSTIYFTDDTFTNFAVVSIDSSISPQATVNATGSGGARSIPFSSDGVSLFTVDLVVIPSISSGGSLVAAWINGDGPYTVPTSMTAGIGLRPWLQVEDQGSVTFREFFVDWIGVERFTNPVVPDLLVAPQFQGPTNVGGSYMGVPL